MFGSSSGAYTFWMYEDANGSSIITVNFIFPARAVSSLSKNFSQLALASGVIESEVSWNTRECSSSLTWRKRPSNVVNLPPSVPGVRSRLSSGIFSPQVSDLRMSLVRSSGSSQKSVTRFPRSGTAPPVLTSLDL
ncbi:hypothetical protein KL930_002679 [Ogataea haglerorum]|uniref:Uncharacterized protein n=1 Tax=Ogataea haglerorum TaxID=1937702 RepID=A0AAN6D7B6_9ASCO|nr:uncharacterized protein KL911_002020 [Ogataea haglerorum]KAG7696871.1 hypothetical protein KL915_002134 [Ogataea haglerorum]KAG7697439.1 hypothetical protein KL951_002801 [Ogataea haglerorum]KAG7707543.1 hypothetical protein KL914_002364 [Ogataea haglerorum]KAG7709579.1 hypothetical protein KL950_001798 [Ogataea haglerorum]KAG7719657.1 hypothetical protein KL913_001626 [Ogataea haglerorum]